MKSIDLFLEDSSEPHRDYLAYARGRVPLKEVLDAIGRIDGWPAVTAEVSWAELRRKLREDPHAPIGDQIEHKPAPDAA